MAMPKRERVRAFGSRCAVVLVASDTVRGVAVAIVAISLACRVHSDAPREIDPGAWGADRASRSAPELLSGDDFALRALPPRSNETCKLGEPSDGR